MNSSPDLRYSRHNSASGRVSWARMGTVTLCLALVLALVESILAITLRPPNWVDWTDRFNHIWTVQFRTATLVAIPSFTFIWLAFRVVGQDLRKRWAAVLFGLLVSILFVDLLEYSKHLRLSSSLILGLGFGAQGARWFARNPARLIRWSQWLLPRLVVIALLSTLGFFTVKKWQERQALGALTKAQRDAPNVLLIILDTLRADFLSSHGYSRKTTPFLDSLAAGGVLFEHAYAASSWSLPSHAVIMSGRFPFRHSVRTAWGEIQALDPRYPVLAEVFQRNGYATGGFVANPWYCSPLQGFHRGFLRYQDTSFRMESALRRTGIGARVVQYLFPFLGWYHNPNMRGASAINHEFLSWLDGINGRPFFAFLNYMEVHGPLLPPREFAARFSTDPDRLLARKPVNFLRQEKGSVSSEMRQMELDAYAASTAYLDSKLAELFEQLRQRGLDRNLMLVVTSDHGEAFGEHGLYGHRVALYKPMIHVPLILYFPGKAPEGARLASPVSQRNLAPTIVELAGLQYDNPFPGLPLTGLWAQPPAVVTDPVLSEVSGNPYGDGPGHWPIRKGWLKSWITPRWQYILDGDGFEELFDLQNDPQQSRNWALTPEGKSVAREFRRLLQELVPQARSVPDSPSVGANGR